MSPPLKFVRGDRTLPAGTALAACYFTRVMIIGLFAPGRSPAASNEPE